MEDMYGHTLFLGVEGQPFIDYKQLSDIRGPSQDLQNVYNRVINNLHHLSLREYIRVEFYTKMISPIVPCFDSSY